MLGGNLLSQKISIAIDGPAGAGKSTIAKLLAQKLGIIYIDTGAMYRAVALQTIREGIDTQDQEKIAQLVKDIHINMELNETGQVIYLRNENVNHLIRTQEISIGASNVAKVPEVRRRMVEMQRKIAAENNVVMDGRDIGICVLPQAELKIFLTASVEERAKRRYNELSLKDNCTITLKQVEEDIRFRDFNDMTRECTPLKAAQDAKIVDTTGKSIKEVVDLILEEITKLHKSKVK